VSSRVRALLGRLWRARVVTPSSAPPAPPPPTLESELAASGAGIGWLQSRRLSRRLYSSLDDTRVAALQAAHPAQVAATIAAADRIKAHQFDLLGSGPFVPRDPNRPAAGEYQPIDWYLDPVQHLRFPERVPHTKWNLLEMRPGLADVKFPWELSRCQHWMTLAQAFRMTRDASYAAEILDQHDDFMEANPVGLGVNWTCTMDVALRALNWAMAIELIHGAAIDHGRVARIYSSLFDHGHFIERNLENKYEVTSNHFLSNVVGLFGLAVFFGELPSARRWRESCRGWLEQEMKVQILDDGADYESSIPYHRLVAELFMSAARLAEADGAPLSADYAHRLRQMIEFLDATLRPDGKLPQVGDADDGRVHILSDYADWDPQDARHLLAPAAAMFGKPEWYQFEDAWAQWEAAWWGLDLAAPATPAPRDVARVFAAAGIVVVRNERDYLLITNGIVGTNGFGNHKHNDLLSFEFHQAGVPLIVDPGSFVYTSNPEARNHFRSTAAHNTLAIAGEEQNEFRPEWLFRMFARAVPEHLEFVHDADQTVYRGRHNGYSQKQQPILHERTFTLHGATGALTIHDRLDGGGTHDLVWRFQCAPGIEAVIEPRRVLLRAGAKRWVLQSSEGIPAEVISSWYSPSYGVRVAAPAVRFALESTPTVRGWTFTLERLP
jgi:uncharacterized heparinase superfamily protein